MPDSRPELASASLRASRAAWRARCRDLAASALAMPSVLWHMSLSTVVKLECPQACRYPTLMLKCQNSKHLEGLI